MGAAIVSHRLNASMIEQKKKKEPLEWEMEFASIFGAGIVRVLA